MPTRHRTAVKPAIPSTLAYVLLLLGPWLGFPCHASTASLIEIPVRIPISAITQRLERAVPIESHQRRWRRQRGIDIRYRIWRGPLKVQAVRGRLHVGADVGYWISVRRKLLGPLKLSGSCGLNEPPRVARLHVSTRIFFAPDWGLHSDTRLHSNRFANPCQLTRARIDVTAAVDRALNRRINAALGAHIDRVTPRLSALRERAAGLWHALQGPLELADDAWLLLNPTSVHTAPLRGDGTDLTATIAVSVRPVLVIGAKPDASATPLPELGTRPASTADGLDFTVDVELPLAVLRARLLAIASQRLARMGIGAHDLDAVQLRASGDELVVRSPGWTLRTRPFIDRHSQRLGVELVAMDTHASGGAGSGDADVTRKLQATLDWSYAERARSIREQLSVALNRPIDRDLRLRGQIDSIEPQGLSVTSGSMRATLRIRGKLQLLVE